MHDHESRSTRRIAVPTRWLQYLLAPARLAPFLLAPVLATGCGSSSGGASGAAPAESPEGSAPPQARIRELGAGEAYAFVQSRSDALLLDVRLPPEWEDDLGHLDFAVQIPVQDLEYRISELPPDKERPILVYCRNGLRSVQATQILAKHGYLEIYSIMGGLEAYRQAGY